MQGFLGRWRGYMPLDEIRDSRIIGDMRTVIETPLFQRQAAKLWTDEQRLDFFAWLAANPEAGDVIPGADGARKVRWALLGTGKRGGVRVIYFNIAENGVLILVMMYAKNERENVNASDLARANNGH